MYLHRARNILYAKNGSFRSCTLIFPVESEEIKTSSSKSVVQLMLLIDTKLALGILTLTLGRSRKRESNMSQTMIPPSFVPHANLWYPPHEKHRLYILGSCNNSLGSITLTILGRTIKKKCAQGSSFSLILTVYSLIFL